MLLLNLLKSVQKLKNKLRHKCIVCRSVDLKSTSYCDDCLIKKTEFLKSFSGYFECKDCGILLTNYVDANNHFLRRHTLGHGQDVTTTPYVISTHMEDVITPYYVYNRDMNLYKRK